MLRAPRFPVVVCAAKSSGDSLPHGPFPPPFRLSNPTWVVKTESNVWKEKVEKPEPPCVICPVPDGCVANDAREKVGQIWCIFPCFLKENGLNGDLCSACGGSGLSYCSRCLGTGEYREAMGFHFMKMHGNSARAQHEDHFQ